jgi:hypothetical protein
VHRGTLDTDAASYQSPELIFAIAAIGATYRFRAADAFFLFQASLREVVKQLNANVSLDRQHLSILQSLVLLEYFVNFQKQNVLMKERILVHNELLRHVKRFQPPKPSSQGINWSDWVNRESALRSYLAAFCILNTHSLLHGSAPDLSSLAIQSALPSSTIAWDAPSADHWAAVIPHEAIAPNFQQVLTQLLTGSESMFMVSPFGCLVLLHGVLQRTYHLRQLAFDGTFRATDLAEMEYVTVFLFLSSS